MINDIVVNLSLKQRNATAAPLAVSAARLFGAHLTGVAFEYEPAIPVLDLGAAIPKNYLDEARAEANARVGSAVRQFEELTRREAIKFDVQKITTAAPIAPSRFAQIARRFDLAVVTQGEPDEDNIDDIIAEAALFQSGRPVIFAPYIQTAPLKLDRVTVCWDGSRAAARAIGDAMPMLERAKAVDLLVIEKERPKSEDFPGIDIANHIARHRVEVKLTRLPLENDVAATMLNFAADAGTDLLVMGGYGHSRLREFVLGGATKGILRSMTVPVLMSH